MPDRALIIDNRTKTIRLPKGLEDHKLIINGIETKQITTEKTITNYIESDDAMTSVNEWITLITIPQDATFPYEIKYRECYDINNTRLPTTIDNAFPVSVDTVDLDIKVIVKEWDNTSFTIRLSHGLSEPITEDWQLKVVIRGGYKS